MKLFFKDPGRQMPWSHQELEKIGRQVMVALVDPTEPTGPARIAVLKNDAIWAAMDDKGAVTSFGTIDGLQRLKPERVE